MPETAPDPRWSALNDALEQLLELDPADRPEALAALPPALRRDAEAALAAIDRQTILDLIAAEAAARPARTDDPAALVGRRIGGFRLQRLLGIGGMSWVYDAERQQGGGLQRVALKRLRPDIVSDRLRRRFLDEQRIVAALQHPGIARMIAAGVDDDGVPWLATELVSGESLLAWCDARALPLDDRLQLFGKICAAVGAAHRALIIHRDLKPANILVDQHGEPRLLDFGISRLLEPGADTEPGTRGDWRLLTPEYAAPEQLSGAPPTTAVDVYALGVILHELVCGQRPVTALYRQDDQGALRPASACIDADAAARRGTTPDALRRRVRGDLDAIIATTLAFDPARRYASAMALARDLEAHRLGHPVQARPGGALDRALRFIRRNALASTFAALALLASIAGVASLMLESARRERALARAEAVEHFLVGLFESASLSTREVAHQPVSTLLAQGAQDAARMADTQPALGGRLLWVIGQAQDHLDLIDPALQSYSGAIEAAGRAGDALTEANARIGLAWVLVRTGRTPEVTLDQLESAIALLRRHHPDSAALARALGVLASARLNLHQPDAAEQLLGEAIALADAHAPDSAEVVLLRTTLGAQLQLSGRLDEAIGLQRTALELARERFGPSHLQTNLVAVRLAQALGRQGALHAADQLMDETTRHLDVLFPPHHSDRAAWLTERARIAGLLGRTAQADQLLDDALAIARGRDDMDGILVHAITLHQAALRERQGRVDEALALAERAHADLAQRTEPPFAFLCAAIGFTARRLFEDGRTADARARLATGDGCGNDLGEARARALWADGRHDDAMAAYTALLAGPDRASTTPVATLPQRLRYARLLLDAGRDAQAVQQLDAALELCRRHDLDAHADCRAAATLRGEA